MSGWQQPSRYPLTLLVLSVGYYKAEIVEYHPRETRGYYFSWRVQKYPLPGDPVHVEFQFVESPELGKLRAMNAILADIGKQENKLNDKLKKLSEIRLELSDLINKS